MTKLNIPDFTLGSELTQEQTCFFDRNGVVVFRNFLSETQIELYLSETQRIEKQWLDEGREKVNGIPLKFGKDENGNKMIQRSCFLSLYSQHLQEMLSDQRLTALLQLMKPFEGRISPTEKDGLVF